MDRRFSNHPRALAAYLTWFEKDPDCLSFLREEPVFEPDPPLTEEEQRAMCRHMKDYYPRERGDARGGEPRHLVHRL
jgi:hypothetical protein